MQKHIAEKRHGTCNNVSVNPHVYQKVSYNPQGTQLDNQVKEKQICIITARYTIAQSSKRKINLHHERRRKESQLHAISTGVLPIAVITCPLSVCHILFIYHIL